MTPESPINDVTVLCVTYQSRELVEALSDTLRAFPNILVVDNASSDGTASAMRAALPHARVIENPRNLGFGKACNEAMPRVRTPYVLLLNPDCQIGPNALNRLIDTLRRYPQAGVVAPQSFRADGTPQKSFRPAFYMPMKRAPYRVPDATCSAQWLHGCCLLLRTQTFRLVDGFDERFFLFYEDDDLCLRMLKAGYTCLFEPDARIVHTGGASSTPGWRNQFLRSFHYARSKHLVIRKYMGAGAARYYLFRISVACVPAVVAYGFLLRRKYMLRWLAWGSAALSCLLRPGDQPSAKKPEQAPGHITR